MDDVDALAFHRLRPLEYLDGEERLDLLGPLGDHAVRLDRE
jgi:hypothetical protein